MSFLKRRRWAFLAGAAILVFLFARWMNWNRLRPVIAWSTDRFAGIRVEIGGDLRVVTNGNTTIEVENLRLVDKRDRQRRPPFFEADLLSLVWHLPSLREHGVVLRDGILSEARLHLDRFAPVEDKDDAQTPEQASRTSRWGIRTAWVDVPAFELMQRGRPIAHIRGGVDGALTFSPLSWRGRIEAHGQDLQQTLAAFGYRMADSIPRYEISADGYFTPGRLELSDIQARIQDSSAKGKVAVGFAPLDVLADLHFAELHFADLGAFLPKKVGEELPATRIQQEHSSLYSQAPIATDWLSGPRLDVHAQVDRFVGTGKASLIESFVLDLDLKNDTCHIAVPRARIMGGDLRTDLTLTRRSQGLAAHLAGSAKELRTGRIFQEFMTPDALKKRRIGKLTADELVEGSLDAFLDVKGQGKSLSAIMATLDGEAGIYLGEGKVSSLLVELLGMDLTETLGVLLARKQQVAMQCTAIGAKVDQGVMSFDPAFVSTSDSDILAQGELDLKNEEVRLELRTRPKDPSLGSLRTPIRISGQLIDPQVSLDAERLAGRVALGIALGLITPAAALLAIIEPGDAPKQSCESYREQLVSLRFAH